MTADALHAEEILYHHTFQVWQGCSDPLRRGRYFIVLEMNRQRLRRLGFTDERLRQIETFGETREGVGE